MSRSEEHEHITKRAMIVCIDVGYREDTARAACIAFDDWDDACSINEYTVDLVGIEPYVPGQFYRRELPCVLAVLDKLPTPPAVIVVDGYVWLDDNGRKGLGVHLYEALNEDTPIVGVAKTRFATATGAVEILRGCSDRPLILT